ncbi:AraC family transcriptional regulator [Paenibacillus contaminans]|nr:AraC family transcriptional regulator [Paenibacillus contaminans]
MTNARGVDGEKGKRKKAAFGESERTKMNEKALADAAGLTEYGHEYAEVLLFTPAAWERKSGIWPVRAGTNVAKPEYKVGPKVIEWYSLHAVRSGRTRLAYGDASVELEKGDIFCLFPGVTYDYRIVHSESPLLLAWLAFDGEQAGHLLEIAGLTPRCPYVRSAYKGEAADTFDELIRHFRGSVHREGNGNGGYLRLVSLFYRLFEKLEAGKQTKETTQNEWVGRGEAFMRMHFTEGITVDDAAKHAGVSRSHFSVVFTRQMGIAPVSFLQRLRMEKASRMLRETGLPVTEIALSLGYPELYSFTRAFSNYFGQSPTKFREEGIIACAIP